VIQEICWGGQALMPGIIYVYILLLFILNKLLEKGFCWWCFCGFQLSKIYL